MTATTALTLPRRRRPHVATTPRLMPVRPVDPPYDDETVPPGQPAGRAPGADRSAGARYSRVAAPTATSAAPPTATSAAVSAVAGPVNRAERGAARHLLPDQRTLPWPRPTRTTRAPVRQPADGPVAVTPPGPGPSPDPRRTAAVVVRVIIEVLSGARPAAHLAPWSTAALQSDFERTASSLATRQPSQVRSVRVSEPLPGVAEVSAVVSRGARVRALALRMEHAAGRWQVTTLQLG
ncbi:Rv3235 family protein [Parafrankia discariae]|uniref:Rv3235 family protein n=1 Tax=Parafrankia discariae TaxID=365528 RepID=UPI00036FCCEF|nr:Rv3235 family protein [Parafrankia discariae]